MMAEHKGEQVAHDSRPGEATGAGSRMAVGLGGSLGFVIILEVTLKVLTDRRKAGSEGKGQSEPGVMSELMV